MTDLYSSLLSLRAIREFDARAVEEADLEALLEAARWTGSAKNLQHWSFIVVDDPLLKERLCGAGDFTGPIRSAPAVICLVQEPNGYEFDIGRLAQNIMLAADAIGMASCPITLHREHVATEVLRLPEGRTSRYAVAIGYPTSRSRPARLGGRKPIENLVHRNTYNA